jgi:hypothetical protein
MATNLTEIGQLIINNARFRWLHPEEIFLLLVRTADLNVPIQKGFVQTPGGMTVIYCFSLFLRLRI